MHFESFDTCFYMQIFFFTVKFQASGFSKCFLRNWKWLETNNSNSCVLEWYIYRMQFFKLFSFIFFRGASILTFMLLLKKISNLSSIFFLVLRFCKLWCSVPCLPHNSELVSFISLKTLFSEVLAFSVKFFAETFFLVYTLSTILIYCIPFCKKSRLKWKKPK